MQNVKAMVQVTETCPACGQPTIKRVAMAPVLPDGRIDLSSVELLAGTKAACNECLDKQAAIRGKAKKQQSHRLKLVGATLAQTTKG